MVYLSSLPSVAKQKIRFRMLAEDNVATNPAVTFRVESFEPTDGFKPAKPYQTRLLWRDPASKSQSKLLITRPEA
jgi:hypothetical protein